MHLSRDTGYAVVWVLDCRRPIPNDLDHIIGWYVAPILISDEELNLWHGENQWWRRFSPRQHYDWIGDPAEIFSIWAREISVQTS